MSQTVLVETCPGCAAHLDDTWNGDECERCGFAYVHVEASRTPTQRTPGARLMKRTTAGVLAVTSATLAGLFITNSELITTVPAANGVEAVAFNAPDGAFWSATVLLGAALLLVAYTTWEAPGGVTA